MTTTSSNNNAQVGSQFFHPALARFRAGGAVKENGGGVPFEANIFLVYAGVLMVGGWVFHTLGGDFVHASKLDKIYYASSIIEAFGLMSLLLKIGRDKSVAGLSGKTMVAYGCEYFLRTLVLTVQGGVSSLTTLSFEFLDILALLMALRVLYCIFVKHRDTYQQEDDRFPVHYLLIACVLLPMVLEGDAKMGPLKNYIWNVCLYLEMTALLPQVYMIAQAGVGVEALVSHFVAATTCSRLLDVVYWYHGFAMLAPLHGGFNFSGWLVVGCHIGHALLLGDFMYYYLKFRLVGKGGMMSEMPEGAMV